MTRLTVSLVLLAALMAALSGPLKAQIRPEPRITRMINEAELTTLRGNVHSLARPQFDQGAAPQDLPMERMLLVLTRSTAQQSALDTLLEQQQNPSSPQYHQWLTPQEFGERFGAADEDIQTVTAWLRSKGFTVNRVSNGKVIIDFSGTAAQVQVAFHTEIHQYMVNGAAHWANASDPQVPAALAPAVAGIVSLHNFYKKPQLVASGQQLEADATSPRPQFTSFGVYALAPADYATIYNINPLYQAGINGSGITIAVVARSNINVTDVNQFRSVFGLSSNPPQVIVNGTDPGDLGGSEEAEAVLDTSWAGATSTGATVKVVVSRSTNSADGTDLSELYIVDNNLGDVMTESFGACEAEFGSSAQSAASYYSSLAQQAAAEGITYAVAAGDSGAEGCDDPSQPSATGPLSVNILASTPYTIAVGGTMFNENGNYALYWNSTNNSVQASAKTYIPENAWNESCTAANGLNPCTGGNTPALWAGGGGASTLFAKPSWQTGVPGIPNDGRRDVPDVSLTAAGHDAYLLCLRGSCTPNSRGRISFSGYGGTSAATPSFAGIMALVVQKYGRQGQATPVLYGLAAEQNLAACNASNSAADCIFNDVRVGNNAVPGEANYGSNSAAYQTTYGYDLATGLGSVNVTNLVNGWNGARNSAPHFRIFSERPGGANNTFFGSAVFSGWAVHDTAAITTIQIAIDGASYGTATYGLARADVCAVYPGRQGCPNVGWSISVDTTQLANGAHTLEITATNTLGAHATSASSFTVANWSAANPMIVNVDVPNSSTSYTGTVAFGGWALDNAGAIGSVAIAVDGVPFGNAVYGVNRQDVCAVFPGRTGCPNVGWTFNLDTTLLADGTHRLAVSGFTQAGENTTVTTTFTTANLSASPIAITIDVPNANSGTFSGPASFGGWALTNNNTAIMSVGIYIDGVFLRNALYGVNRTDVCAAFPGRAGCPGVGWTVVVDTTLLANGSHVLDVTATNSAGLRLTKSTSFVVANSQATAPLKVFIDSPNATNATVTGLINVVGWALDNNGPVSSVVISVDGAPRGNASYGVASRPDVCAVFPVAACPSVGWTYSLDTTLIPDGVHLLAVTASSANGDNVTATTMITVANWTTGNPMHITIDIPSSQSPPLSGVVNVGGWAISDIAAVTSVSIAVDGDPFGPVAYGMTRTDVCGAYPGRAGCPNVGWTYALDTTLLPNGAHTLDVTATSSGGQRSTVTGSFQVANSANPLIIFIDSPAAGTYTTSQATISGWAVDQTPSVGIASVQILVDGVVYGTANSVSRPDVCAVSPGAAGCPNVGWNFVLDTTLLSNGNHSLEIRATAIDGHRETVSTPFSVVNNP